MIKKITAFISSFALAATILVPVPATADEIEWPREIVADEGTIVIYQPQLESFEKNKLTGRAAVSVTLKGRNEPVFGAIWFAARVSTDRDTRMVELLELDLTNVRFPNADQDKIDKFTEIVEREVPKWDLDISLDRLLTSLELVEKEKTAAESFKTSPPKIYFATQPTVLVIIDGEPELRSVEGKDLMRVINTPFLVVLDLSTSMYYLKGGDLWYRAGEVKGPWQTESTPPKTVSDFAEQISKEGEQGQETSKTPADQVPDIIVSTEPAELIVADGDPKYTPINGTRLLYMSNTESDVFMDISSQLYYVLLSGRWFSASSMTADWAYVPPNELSEDFAKIPSGSEKEHVLSSVAGTQAAKDAILDAQIPQTATVSRSEASLIVEYDGEPKFEKIEDTDMQYAVNTSSSVIRIEDRYYCCEDAVWFVADDPLGPWSVCTSVPEDVNTIPPSCPVYNVKYVYVYDYTPEVVYVGYTPGYVGCYVHGGTVVYGT
jgi:hypothetical protein